MAVCSSAVSRWTSKEHFLERTRELLSLERSEQMEEEATVHRSMSLDALEKRGVCCRRLEVAATLTGLFGRTVEALTVHPPFWTHFHGL